MEFCPVWKFSIRNNKILSLTVLAMCTFNQEIQFKVSNRSELHSELMKWHAVVCGRCICQNRVHTRCVDEPVAGTVHSTERCLLSKPHWHVRCLCHRLSHTLAFCNRITEESGAASLQSLLNRYLNSLKLLLTRHFLWINGEMFQKIRKSITRVFYLTNIVLLYRQWNENCLFYVQPRNLICPESRTTILRKATH